MTVYNKSPDSSGKVLFVPPYSLADGTYSVRTRETVNGVAGPWSGYQTLVMPNTPKQVVTSLINRMSTMPPAGRDAQMYDLVSTLVMAGLWSKLDTFYMLSAHSAQAAQLNWVGGNYNLVAYNSPTFTANRGFKGDGVASWLDAGGYDPNVTPSRLTLNGASIGIWIVTPSAGVGIDLYGGSGWMARRNTGVDWHYRVNDSTSNFGQPGDTPGFYVGCRADSNTKRLYKNGTQLITHTAPSTTNMNRLSLFGQASGNYSTAEVGFVFSGANLTDAENAVMYNAVRAYLLAIGTPIA